MICEDAASELEQEIGGIRPLRFMIPNLLSLYLNPDARLRVQAINATGQLLKQPSFAEHLDSILTSVYTNLNDPDPHVRQEFGRMLTILLEAYPQEIEPYLFITIEYMLHAILDDDQNIVLAACDFWVQYAHIDLYKQHLLPYLPRLLSHLLHQMVYSESDLIDLNQVQLRQKEDQSIRPRYFTPKNQSDNPAAAIVKENTDELSDLEEESDFDDDNSSCSSSSSISISPIHQHIPQHEDEDDDEDEEFYSRESTRQCSASALDMLSVTFGDTMATILLDQLFSHTLPNEHWLVRESGILALGAAAEGGINVIGDHLHKLLPYLLKSMSDPQVQKKTGYFHCSTELSKYISLAVGAFHCLLGSKQVL